MLNKLFALVGVPHGIGQGTICMPHAECKVHAANCMGSINMGTTVFFYPLSTQLCHPSWGLTHVQISTQIWHKLSRNFGTQFWDLNTAIMAWSPVAEKKRKGTEQKGAWKEGNGRGGQCGDCSIADCRSALAWPGWSGLPCLRRQEISWRLPTDTMTDHQ